ncbi:MAG: RND transporter [Chloroflexota bacterium]|nr:HlyD family efflux transporter periplasmic adaptor subunit [Chloroflexota bacterium]GIK63638.1 MAG: RND transporter [Chloroflexota bacterium]
MQEKFDDMKKHVFALMALLMLVSACTNGDPNTNDPSATITSIPTAPAAARPKYTVQRGNVEEIFEFSGRWQPRDQMELSFEINGTIRQVNVRQGDAVSTGQLLADYQIEDLEEQLVSAELSLETAQTNLETGAGTDVQSVEDAEIRLANAKLSLEQTKASRDWTGVANARISLDAAQRDLENAEQAYQEALSHPEQGASAVDNAYTQLLNAQDNLRRAENSYFSAAQSYNNAEFNIKQQENSVIEAELALERARSGQGDPSGLENLRQAQLKVDQLKADIARSSLYAPIDGVILEVSISPGDQVTAYNAVMTIGLPEPKEVIASLAIGDAQNLSAGMVGVCQVANKPETAVQCAVRRIPSSNRDADQTTRIAAGFENLTDGQLIQVYMPLQIRENVLWLPPAAIRTFQNRTFVVLDTPDGQRSVDVELGLQTDDRVEIVSGVNEGDVVVGP